MTITVSQLRAHLENIPGDTIIVGDECDHAYRKIWCLPTYTTVLYDKDNGMYNQDIYMDGPVGEETDMGVRVNALVID